MALCREKIERFEIEWARESDKPWQNLSHSRKWMKHHMNKYRRLKGNEISDAEVGFKQGRKPQRGWEYEKQKDNKNNKI